MPFGTGTINAAGGAVSDLFAAEGHRLRAQGTRIEAGNYDEAAEFAGRNALYTEHSTAIKQQQADRAIFGVFGQQQAGYAASGLKSSGSALDVMASSAAQGQLSKSVLTTQGQIAEEGYLEQEKSFKSQGDAARLAADAEDNAATGAEISAAFKGISAVASIFLK